MKLSYSSFDRLEPGCDHQIDIFCYHPAKLQTLESDIVGGDAAITTQQPKGPTRIHRTESHRIYRRGSETGDAARRIQQHLFGHAIDGDGYQHKTAAAQRLQVWLLSIFSGPQSAANAGTVQTEDAANMRAATREKNVMKASLVLARGKQKSPKNQPP